MPRTPSVLAKLKINVRNNLVVVVVSAVVVYYTIIGWNYYDVRYFISWYEDYFKTGRILEVYTSSSKVAYPPLAVLLFVTTHAIATSISSNIIVWRIIDKLPLLLSYYITYVILRKRFGVLASYLWLLNLVAIYIMYSYQFDPLVSLFILLALLRIEKGDYRLYGVFIALAAMFKHAVAILGLIPLVELARDKKWRTLLVYIGVTLLVAFIVIGPFLLVNPWMFIEKVLLFHMRRPPQQLSIWTVPLYIARYDLDAVPSAYYNIWIIFFLLYLAWVIKNAWRDRIENKLEYYVKYQVLLMIGFLVMSKVSNIPYFLWLAPSLLILTTMIKQRNTVIASKLIRIYLYVTVTITIVYEGVSSFTLLVSGYPVFLFEDWNWIPMEKFLVESIGYGPLIDFQYSIILFVRLIPMLREACKSIAIIHHYILAIICALYTISLLYVAKIACKYPRLDK